MRLPRIQPATWLLLAMAVTCTGSLGVRADAPKPDAAAGSLFNGMDLGGWQVRNKQGGEILEKLDGKTATATKRALVADGCIVFDPNAK
jgi:hypothetical protein